MTESVAEAKVRVTNVLAYSRRISRAGSPDAAVVELAALNADESISAYDKRQIIALALYSMEYDLAQRDKRSRRARRANALLRSFLTAEQREQWRRTRHFLVRGSLGNIYRLYPPMGNVWRVERRGSRWVGIAAYCLHDYAEDDPTFVPSGLPGEGKQSRLPSADRTLAHLLLLRADEAEFRLLANESIRARDNEWHFRLRAERQQIERNRDSQMQEVVAA